MIRQITQINSNKLKSWKTRRYWCVLFPDGGGCALMQTNYRTRAHSVDVLDLSGRIPVAFGVQNEDKGFLRYAGYIQKRSYKLYPAFANFRLYFHFALRNFCAMS